MNQITTSTAPASVGSKRPPRKRKRTEEEHPFQQIEDEEALQSEHLTSQSVGETTLLITKNKKPDDPIPSAPLVLKRLLEECESAQDAEEISPRQSEASIPRMINTSALAVSRHIVTGTRTATLTSQLCQRDTTISILCAPRQSVKQTLKQICMYQEASGSLSRRGLHVT